jgi:hypothetical protein
VTTFTKSFGFPQMSSTLLPIFTFIVMDSAKQKLNSDFGFKSSAVEKQPFLNGAHARF